MRACASSSHNPPGDVADTANMAKDLSLEVHQQPLRQPVDFQRLSTEYALCSIHHGHHFEEAFAALYPGTRFVALWDDESNFMAEVSVWHL
eukprot:SAG11_NODE_18473_length_490_cov_0.787724_1_plen_91_part_00